MSQLIQIIGLPFLACILMGSVLGYMGIHVLKREVIFVDIALAQVAAVGAIISHLAFEAHEGSVLSYVCSNLYNSNLPRGHHRNFLCNRSGGGSVSCWNRAGRSYPHTGDTVRQSSLDKQSGYCLVFVSLFDNRLLFLSFSQAVDRHIK